MVLSYIFQNILYSFCCSVGSNGIIKKKKKKNKHVAQKLSSELKEAVTAASNIAKTPVSSKKMKNKKNKNSNLQRSIANTQKIDTISQKTSDHNPAEVPASVKSSGVQRALKDGSPAALGSKNAENTGKKKKRRRKTGQTKEGMPMTPESNEARERRTVFVGNVSTKTTRKSLARFFSKYGKVLVSK